MNQINVAAWLEKIRAERPLVHNITNVVVTNIAANALLAIGGSPVMAYAKQEVADMAKIASSLALNMGTLDEAVVEAMLIAGRSANDHSVPIVFDPVGVGATPYRNESASLIAKELKLTVLRGNAGEIGVFLGAGGEVKGVDAASSAADLPHAMQRYAKEHGCVVIATGETDYVTDGERLFALYNGHPLMAMITGSGCMATALLGGFLGAAGRQADLNTYADACVAALTCYNIAGEIAADHARGPGTFQAALFDALYHLTPAQAQERAKVEMMGAQA